ncbi:MAG: insulinase family protein [Muribaculaceae bacterium]|nr:insulinase family protein [Muribaculaceae bacterium]
MKKQIFSLMLMLLAVVAGVYAQAPGQEQMQLTPMPLMPGVRSGVLPNGLHYYVLHNSEPKNRANFYIAQKVGSTLETPEQLGLAHFLEHMAFNGTKTYPGKDLLNYLQSKGIRFGQDINAYTSFDETVYNIDNVPCSDKALMDSVLLALRDWSCNILLEETEIEAERGVIHSEWRSRNDANTRMYTAILPQLYEEYQYEQMPIGSMDVVLNFKPQALRDYYHKWYRPDQQGIIVVGDFDAAEMEKKVVELFSQIPMPENAAERTYPNVSDNVQPIYVTFEDPELKSAVVTLSFKFDPIPLEFRNTYEVYLQDNILNTVLTTLLNNRLNEYSEKPECKYIAAGCWIGDYYVSKTKRAFNVRVVSKGDAKAAMEDAMSIITRACKTGFTDSELERVDSQIISQYEALYNERDKTKTGSLAEELIRNFIDNEPAPGIAEEYKIVSENLPQLPVQLVNAMASQLLTPNNQVMVVAQPKNENFVLPERETMIQALNSILNAQYEVYVDEVLSEPLIAKMPKKGKIKSEKQNAELGTTEMMLSNGVKVVVKPTDFASDEILITMFREGGKRNYPASQAANVQLLDDAYDQSNFGPYDSSQIRKYLAGKQVSIGLTVGLSTLSFDGQSTVKDFQTLMELLYTSFAGMKPNQAQYDVYIDKARKMLAMQANDPMFIFTKTRNEVQWGNNPVMNTPDIATTEQASYPEMFKMLKDATANAANYTLIITGNVDLKQLRPLLEQYVASLPSKGKKDAVAVLNPVSIADGDIEKKLDVTMQTPAIIVYDVYSGNNLPYNMKNSVMLDLFSDVLDNNYITTLREEEGGTYGASVGAQMLPASDEWMLMYFFETNEEKAQTLIDRAHKEMLELMANGTNAVEFNKVKEAMLKQYELKLRQNNFWLGELLSIERGYDMYTGRQAYMESITLEDFNNYIKTMYPGKDRIQIIVDGKVAE